MKPSLRLIPLLALAAVALAACASSNNNASVSRLGGWHNQVSASSGSLAAARDLDSRDSDGIHVQLLWHPHDGHISIAVNDSKTGQTFQLEVVNRRRALDVFHHPYAYPAETPHLERLATHTAH